MEGDGACELCMRSMMARGKLYTEYDPFAWLYANHWGKEFHSQIELVLDRLLLRRMPPPARILDLCCGDGRLAAQLVGRGYDVTGLDGSSRQLAFARKAAPHARFILADARYFTLPQPVEVCMSLFDSLNHVPSLHGLQQVFKRSVAALRADGYFAFDLNRERAYTDLWTQTNVITKPDMTSVAQGKYNRSSRMAICEITLFRKARGESWRRSDFRLTQRFHEHGEVVAALERAGFTSIAAMDAADDLGMRGAIGLHRTFYLARKAG